MCMLHSYYSMHRREALKEYLMWIAEVDEDHSHQSEAERPPHTHPRESLHRARSLPPATEGPVDHLVKYK